MSIEKDKVSRLSIGFSDRAAAKLEELAKKSKINKSDVANRAVLTQAYLEEVEAQGGKIYAEMPDGDRERIVFIG